MIKYILLILLLATPALAKEKHTLCVAPSTCTVNSDALELQRDDTLEVAVDDDTACPDTATYSIQGQNTGGTNWHEIAILSTTSNGISAKILEPALWYPTFRAVPSDVTGCTSLEVNLWITRN